MPLSTKSFSTIAGLSIALLGVVAVPVISSPSGAEPFQPLWRSSPQMPMNLSQMPMHQGGWGSGSMNQNWNWMGGHSGSMMQANNEFEFLSLMIPHHEEAISTAERVLKYSDRPEMQQFAQDIIEVQTAEVKQMEAWLDEWYPNRTTNLTYTPMMRDLDQLEGETLDQAFLADMIRHHMGAVMMSQRLVNFGLVEHPEVRPFAQNIANTQRQEIWQMQSWLRDWYGTTGMPMGNSMMPCGMPF